MVLTVRSKLISDIETEGNMLTFHEPLFIGRELRNMGLKSSYLD